MEPVVTLPYHEWIVAEELTRRLPAATGYSVCVPLSRQQKGFDLVVALRREDRTSAATIQVKFSRVYEQPASVGLRFGTWFNTFDPPLEADFFALASLYPTSEGRHRGARESWWRPLILLFTQLEMAQFMASVKTRRGTRDKMFGFGFSSPEQVVQLRGDQERLRTDFTAHVLERRLQVLADHLRAA